MNTFYLQIESFPTSQNILEFHNIFSIVPHFDFEEVKSIFLTFLFNKYRV